MGGIVAESWLRADLARVFAFFSDPENLPRLMPAKMSVRLERLDLKAPSERCLKLVVESGAEPRRVAGPGSLVDISFRLVPFLPIRGRWTAEILEYEPFSYFLDIQRSGPMRSWRHRHSFAAETRGGASGTIVRDEVEYELPFGALGRVVDSVVVRRILQNTFQSRQKELEHLLSGPSR